MRRLLLAAAAATLMAGCASTPTPQPDPTPAPSGHGSYAECLAHHGVATPPAGPGAPAGVDEQTWTQARQACAEFAPGPAA